MHQSMSSFFLSFLFFYIALLPQNARSSCCKKRGKQAVFLPAGSKKYRFANFFQLALLDSPHKKPGNNSASLSTLGRAGATSVDLAARSKHAFAVLLGNKRTPFWLTGASGSLDQASVMNVLFMARSRVST